MSFLDVPQDVLTKELAGFLDSESILALNEAIPSRRICRRFPPNFAEAHHIRVCASKWKASMDRVYLLDIPKRSLLIYKIVQDLARPVNTLLALSKPSFLEQLTTKLREFLAKEHGGAADECYYSAKWLRMFKRQCVKTLAAYGLSP